MSDSKAILSVKERIEQRLANVAKSTTAPSSKRISTQGGVFTLPDGTKSPGPLNCIVLDYINTNSYYDTPYNATDIKPPACWAVGRILEEMRPDDSIENPVNGQCAGCPNNEFGSAGRGKACTNNVQLAIVPEEFNEDSDILTLKISPTGITPWSTYVRSLANAGVDVSQVVTSIAFKEGVSYPTLTFKNVGGNNRVDEAMAHAIQADTIMSNIMSAA